MKTIPNFDFQQFVVDAPVHKEKPVQPVAPRLRSVTPSKEDLDRYLVEQTKYSERRYTYAGELEEWKNTQTKHTSQCLSSWDKFVNQLIKHLEIEPTPEIFDIIKTFGSRTGFSRGSLERMVGTYESMIKWKGKVSEITFEKIPPAHLGTLSSTDIEGIAIAIEQLRNAVIRFIPLPNTKDAHALCMNLLNEGKSPNGPLEMPEVVNHGKVIRMPASKFVKYLLMRIGKEPSKL